MVRAAGRALTDRMDNIGGRQTALLQRRHLKMAPTARPRRFELVRHADVSGVSGTGVVAEGVEWSDGTVTLHWCGRYPTTTVWQDGIEAVRAIHGHQGATTIRWLDT